MRIESIDKATKALETGDVVYAIAPKAMLTRFRVNTMGLNSYKVLRRYVVREGVLRLDAEIMICTSEQKLCARARALSLEPLTAVYRGAISGVPVEAVPFLPKVKM